MAKKQKGHPCAQVWWTMIGDGLLGDEVEKRQEQDPQKGFVRSEGGFYYKLSSNQHSQFWDHMSENFKRTNVARTLMPY